MNEFVWVGCIAYVLVGGFLVGASAKTLYGKPVTALLVVALWPLVLAIAAGAIVTGNDQ